MHISIATFLYWSFYHILPLCCICIDSRQKGSLHNKQLNWLIELTGQRGQQWSSSCYPQLNANTTSCYHFFQVAWFLYQWSGLKIALNLILFALEKYRTYILRWSYSYYLHTCDETKHVACNQDVAVMDNNVWIS